MLFLLLTTTSKVLKMKINDKILVSTTVPVGQADDIDGGEQIGREFLANASSHRDRLFKRRSYISRQW